MENMHAFIEHPTTRDFLLFGGIHAQSSITAFADMKHTIEHPTTQPG